MDHLQLSWAAGLLIKGDCEVRANDDVTRLEAKLCRIQSKVLRRDVGQRYTLGEVTFGQRSMLKIKAGSVILACHSH